MAQIDPNEVADPAVLARIVEGRFDDPFAVLGPHQRGSMRHVTAFDPVRSRWRPWWAARRIR